MTDPVWGARMVTAPILLVDLTGHCTYASGALAKLLQCGLHELYGTGWRPRLSPYAAQPFNPTRAIAIARHGDPIRLWMPGGNITLVTRMRLVTNPADPSAITGFVGRVQLVRVHRRLVPPPVVAQIA